MTQRELRDGTYHGYVPMRTSWIAWRHGILIDKLLWLVAMCCGVLMLLAPLSPRDTWVHAGADARANPGSVSTGRAWALVIGAMGVVAVCALAIGALTRQKVIIPPLCTTVATVAFGLAALSSGVALTDRPSWSASLPEFRLHTTSWADTFVVVALVAFACSTVLTIMWLKPAQDDW